MIALSVSAIAHPGGLDKNGGHINGKTGKYHIHSAAKGNSGKNHPEAYYRDLWVERNGSGQTEVVMPDGTRCDIVTDELAIEVDWAKKWYEALGQSLWYAFQTNKRPAVVLILRESGDEKYAMKMRSVVAHYGLQIEVLTINE